MEEPELPTADWGDEDPQPAERVQVPEQTAKKRRLNTADEIKDVRTPPRVQRILKQAKTFEDFRK